MSYFVFCNSLPTAGVCDRIVWLWAAFEINHYLSINKLPACHANTAWCFYCLKRVHFTDRKLVCGQSSYARSHWTHAGINLHIALVIIITLLFPISFFLFADCSSVIFWSMKRQTKAVIPHALFIGLFVQSFSELWLTFRSTSCGDVYLVTAKKILRGANFALQPWSGISTVV